MYHAAIVIMKKIILITLFLIALAIFYIWLYNYNYNESKELMTIAEKEFTNFIVPHLYHFSR
jgi:hypothetical protein